MNLANRVIQLREQRGWSQAELSRRMGYQSRATINKIEKGKSVGEITIRKLAEVFQVSIPYILGYEDDPYSELVEVNNVSSSIIYTDGDFSKTIPVFDCINQSPEQYFSEQRQRSISDSDFTRSIEGCDFCLLSSDLNYGKYHYDGNVLIGFSKRKPYRIGDLICIRDIRSISLRYIESQSDYSSIIATDVIGVALYVFHKI